MDALTWFFLPVILGPVLIGVGLWCCVIARRAMRSRPRRLGVAAMSGFGATVLILVGLAATAQALLLLLYAWNHNPPRAEVVEIAPSEEASDR